MGTLKPSITYPLLPCSPHSPLFTPHPLPHAPRPTPQTEVVETLQASVVVWILKYSMVVGTLKSSIKCPQPSLPLASLTPLAPCLKRGGGDPKTYYGPQNLCWGKGAKGSEGVRRQQDLAPRDRATWWNFHYLIFPFCAWFFSYFLSFFFLFFCLFSMTRWSRHDPVIQPQASADHWCKMRMRVTALNICSLCNRVSIICNKSCSNYWWLKGSTLFLQFGIFPDFVVLFIYLFMS